MNKWTMLLLAMACAACTTTVSQVYKPDANTEWKIEGSESALGEVNISINGEPAVNGKVSLADGAGEFAGSYQGHALTVKCTKGGHSEVRSRCVMMKGDERIAVLVFKSL